MKINSYDIRVFNAFCRVADNCSSRRELTMNRIAEEVGVSRQALGKIGYHEFNDVLSALHSYLDQDISTKMEEAAKNKIGDPLQFFAAEILPLMYKKRRYLKTVYWKIADPEWRKLVVESYSPVLYPYLKNSDEKYGFDKEFLAKMIIGQVLSIIAGWMKQKNPEPPDKFAEKFLRLISQPLVTLLQD
jgi:hypothetical protein